ncbi:MAG: hypothetical protein ACOX7R_05735 [Acetivibrionales bacterium]
MRREDIDTNNHVNNTRYVNWILETIPLDIYENFSLKTLDIVYKKEVGYGSSVSCICSSDNQPDPSNSVFTHAVLNKKDNTELATARTTWHKYL